MQEQQYLVIRVDATITLGTGHAMRCLALAQAWQAEGGAVLFCTNVDFPELLSQRLAHENITKLSINSPPGSTADALETKEYCDQFNSSWLVVDGYHFDSHYQEIIKSLGLKLLMVDDYGHCSSYCADLILNQNVYANAQLYTSIAPKAKLLLGCSYALLRREFWPWRKPLNETNQTFDVTGFPEACSSPLRILVTLGGSDPHNITATVIQSLGYLPPHTCQADVILGASNPHLAEVKAICQGFGEQVTLHTNVLDMPALIATANLAISAAGSTCWELAFMGVPALLIVLADNQKLVAQRLHELGIDRNLGWYNALTPQLIAQELVSLIDRPDILAKMRHQAVQLVDGYGSTRVVNAVKAH